MILTAENAAFDFLNFERLAAPTAFSANVGFTAQLVAAIDFPASGVFVRIGDDERKPTFGKACVEAARRRGQEKRGRGTRLAVAFKNLLDSRNDAL